MTNDQPDFSFEKYEGAALAQQYVKAKDFGRADAALKNVPLDDDGRTLLENDPHYATPEGIRSASDLYGNQFTEGLNGQQFKDLIAFYSTQIADPELSPDVRERIGELFNEYGSKKLENVEQKVSDASKRLKGREAYKRDLAETVDPDKLEQVYSQGIRRAEKTIEKYGALVTVRQILQEGRNAPLERSTRNSLLEKLVEPNESESGD